MKTFRFSSTLVSMIGLVMGDDGRVLNRICCLLTMACLPPLFYGVARRVSKWAANWGLLLLRVTDGGV